MKYLESKDNIIILFLVIIAVIFSITEIAEKSKDVVSAIVAALAANLGTGNNRDGNG